MFGKIKKIAAVTLLSAMLLLTFSSCSDQSSIPEGYQLVACEGDSFRLYVPTQWTPNISAGVTGAFYSVNENSSVTVYTADDAGEMTAEEYWEHSRAVLEASLKEFSFSEKTEKTVLGGQPALKAVYSAKININKDGEVSETVYKFMQVMARNDGKMYILVYSAPEEYYDSHIEEVEGNTEGAGIIPYFTFAEPYSSGEEKEYSDKVTAPDGMKLISTDERAYRFFVPENWTVNEKTEISAAYYSETDSSNVSAQMYMTGDESQTVDDYFAGCEERYAEIFEAYELLSAEDIEMDGLAARQYIYTAVIGGTEYKQLQAIVMKGAVFYTVTYTALPENFDSHMDDVKKMIENFDIR